MNATRFWILTILLIMGSAGSLFAQRPNPQGPDGGTPPGPGGRSNAKQITGMVLARENAQVRLVLYVKADSPDAPGKVPELMANKAAELENLASQLEARGKMDAARRNRELARELRCWREVEQLVGPGVPVNTLKRVPLEQVPTGMHITMEASVATAPATEAIPERVILIGDVRQAGPRIQSHYEPLSRPGRGGNICRLVGDVVSVSPLVLNVNGNTVTVDNPRTYQYMQLTPMKLRDLEANQRIVVRAQLSDPVTIDKVLMVTVVDGDNPLAVGDTI